MFGRGGGFGAIDGGEGVTAIGRDLGEDGGAAGRDAVLS